MGQSTKYSIPSFFSTPFLLVGVDSLKNCLLKPTCYRQQRGIKGKLVVTLSELRMTFSVDPDNRKIKCCIKFGGFKKTQWYAFLHLVQLLAPFFLSPCGLAKCRFLVKAGLLHLNEQNAGKTETNLIVYATYLSQESQLINC